jgi:hypothetical protein
MRLRRHATDSRPRSLEVESLPVRASMHPTSFLGTQLGQGERIAPVESEPRTTNHEPRTTNHEPRAAAARSQSRGEVRHPARDGMRRAQRLLIGLPRFLPRCTTIPAAAATVPHEDLTTYAHPPRISSQSCAAPSTIHRFNRPPRAKLPAGLEASQILPQEKDRYKRLHVFNCWCFQTPA